MLAHYPMTYRDRCGEAATVLENDGSELRMTLRGVRFSGRDFEAMEAHDPQAAIQRGFKLDNGILCAFVLECEMPMRLAGATAGAGVLLVHFELGEVGQKGWPEPEFLRLELHYDQHRIASSGRSGWFEDELLEIQKQLPQGVHMKACINCAFSDYSPLGHGLFGDMDCYRGNKEAYRLVRSKSDIFRLRATEAVQETYLCPEFERRVPGTGYRG